MNKEFKNYLTTKGYNKKKLHLLEKESIEAVAVEEKLHNDASYTSFIYFRKDTGVVEIWIQKKIDTEDRLGILEKINTLNSYMLASFVCLIDNKVTLKTYATDEDFDKIYKLYQKTLEVAEKYFEEF